MEKIPYYAAMHCPSRGANLSPAQREEYYAAVRARNEAAEAERSAKFRVWQAGR